MRAVERLGDELDLELTVVSPVAGGGYRGTPPPETDLELVRQRLSTNRRITWHQRLSNDEVLTQIQRHHVGLLPTMADTFGYLVLENMGLAVPTIVSNVQALPEFTGPDTGWTIDLPIDGRGVWIDRRPGTDHRRRAYLDALEILDHGLERILRSIRDAPRVLLTRSATARQRLERQFDPIARQEAILAIYARTLR